MEHRYGKRYPVDFQVIVSSRDFGIQAGRAVNISIDGAFVVMPQHALSSNSVVTLHLRVNGALEKIRALVAHRGARGFGVLFRDHEVLRRAGWNRVPALLDSDAGYWMDVG